MSASRPYTFAEGRFTLTAAQVRAARALLDWSQQELAERSGITASSIANLERGRHVPTAQTLATLRACFEAAGVTFSLEPDGTEGVKVRRSSAP